MTPYSPSNHRKEIYPFGTENGKVLYAIVESPNRTDLVGYNIEMDLTIPLVHYPHR